MGVTILRLPGAGWHKRRPPFIIGGGGGRPDLFAYTYKGLGGTDWLGIFLDRKMYEEATSIEYEDHYDYKPDVTLTLAASSYGSKLVNTGGMPYPEFSDFFFADEERTMLKDDLQGKRLPFDYVNPAYRLWSSSAVIDDPYDKNIFQFPRAHYPREDITSKFSVPCPGRPFEDWVYVSLIDKEGATYGLGQRIMEYEAVPPAPDDEDRRPIMGKYKTAVAHPKDVVYGSELWEYYDTIKYYYNDAFVGGWRTVN